MACDEHARLLARVDAIDSATDALALGMAKMEQQNRDFVLPLVKGNGKAPLGERLGRLEELQQKALQRVECRQSALIRAMFALTVSVLTSLTFFVGPRVLDLFRAIWLAITGG